MPNMSRYSAFLGIESEFPHSINRGPRLCQLEDGTRDALAKVKTPTSGPSMSVASTFLGLL